jgi:LuxR family maltose regulon positive regulatory protein
LAAVDADIGKNVLTVLQSPQTPPVYAVMSLLINDITEYSDGIIVVLDDFHLIRAREIHQAGELVKHEPWRRFTGSWQWAEKNSEFHPKR